MLPGPALPSADNDDQEPTTLVARQEGPRSPPALSSDAPVLWDPSFSAAMTSSPTATPLPAVGLDVPATSDPLSALLRLPRTANSSSSSLSSPVTSFFSDSSGATSVSSWSSTTHFPFVPDSDALRKPVDVASRGFSSDPGRTTPHAAPPDLTDRQTGSTSHLTTSPFNQQSPVPDDFLSPDAPLLAQRNRAARQADHQLTSGARAPQYPRGWPPATAPIPAAHNRHQSGVQSVPTSHVAAPPANPMSSPTARDSLLTYAHRLYLSPATAPPRGLSPIPLEHTSPPLPEPHTPAHVYTTQLVPLLTGLRALHPQHLPTLLLYGCVLYAMEDYQGSLAINKEILSMDPNYAEALCNTGTTLRALGRLEEAEYWWWKAIERRPLYWDAIDNLLGSFLSSSVPPGADAAPRYELALALCAYVFAHVSPAVMPEGSLLALRHACPAEGVFAGINDGQTSRKDEYHTVLPTQFHKLQNLLYMATNLRGLLHGTSSALGDHIYVLDVALRPPRAHGVPSPDEAAFRVQTVILAACVVGLLMTSIRDSAVTSALATALGLADISQFPSLVNGEGLWTSSGRVSGIIAVVHGALGRVEQTLLSIGGGVLPTVLLLPGQAMKLRGFLFASTSGRLPALSALADDLEARKLNATVLLGLARVFQDAGAVSTALLCFYLAVSFHPSPSTYNNAGIALSALGTAVTAVVTDDNGHTRIMDGQNVARAYYVNGLNIDSNHPHLLTNLGSLMKDQGQLSEAIQLYNRAIIAKPDFDVALANMANAIKDTGRTPEAIEYYRRAVEVNPDFPEALCGFVNALCAVCDWRGRGALKGAVQEHLRARFDPYVDVDGQLCWLPEDAPIGLGSGHMAKLEELCEQQLEQGYAYGVGALKSCGTVRTWLDTVERALGLKLGGEDLQRWEKALGRFFDPAVDRKQKCLNEGAFAIQLAEYLTRIVQRRWYIDAYGARAYVEDGRPEPEHVGSHLTPAHSQKYWRPRIPASLSLPPVPSVLPFHAFIYPLSIRRTRLLSYRNGIRISYTTLTQPWMPQHVYPPPPPRRGKLHVGYLSGDLNNHPLAHLMQSVFGFHDLEHFSIYVYATSASDGSSYRRKIESESQHFVDCSSWTTTKIINQIVADGIQILINLGGYTKGCRNDILAARPAPLQISVMGFAGTLAAGWSDYLLTDVVACPPETCACERWRQRYFKGDETSRIQDDLKQLDRETDLDVRPDPESLSEQWMYSEKFIYMPYSYFVNDHKQSFPYDDLPGDGAPDERTTDPNRLWELETNRRKRLRQVLFPDLHDDTIIFANFNQLYKIDPVVFATWLRILRQVPNSILWLLRFPAAGENNLRSFARLWAGEEFSARIRFTDVCAKERHIQRSRVADLFLDTIECNAHTIATDVLWSGTPILTWPKYKFKMCSRVAASIARATGFGQQMTVSSLEEYEARAIALARAPSELLALRRALYEGRTTSPLFDTRLWTQHLEVGIREAWRRWVEGTEFEGSDEWKRCNGAERVSASIWIGPDGTLASPPKNPLA
ncbi:protein prenylyltransferase [Auricularia subglabra TFB-10046 SS5]|nr:protein prenylyltransferase [Auricularia subglabra TFB-10046 SS5]